MRLAPQPQLSGSMIPVSGGLRGVRQTIAVMRQFVNQGKVDPAIRQAATSIIFLAPAKNSPAEVERLFDYVQSHVRYTQDINDVETVSTPQKTLAGLIGDCDDQSVLFATFCETVGYPTRFVIAGYNTPGMLEHVYVQVCIDGEWVDADCTESHELGWAPPDPVTIYYEVV